MRTYAILVYLFCAAGVSATEGVLVMVNGDTLSGQIEHKGRRRIVQVKLDTGSGFQLYHVDSVAEIHYSGEQWKRVEIEPNSIRPRQTLFMKTIRTDSSGNQLYKGKYIIKGCGCSDFPKSTLAKGYFISKPNGELRQVFVNRWGFVTNHKSVLLFIGHSQYPNRLRYNELKTKMNHTDL